VQEVPFPRVYEECGGDVCDQTDGSDYQIHHRNPVSVIEIDPSDERVANVECEAAQIAAPCVSRGH
jgi:hypothetical protein